MYRINYTQVAPTLIKHLDLSMQTVLSIDTLSIERPPPLFLQKNAEIFTRIQELSSPAKL